MLADWLSELGHKPVGPAYSVDGALALIETSDTDAAILDVSLGKQSSFPIADRLETRGIAFVFATGMCAEGLDSNYKQRSR